MASDGERYLAGFNAWERLALTVWLVALAAVGSRYLLAPRSHDVYAVFASAAQNWGTGSDLYQRSDGDPYRYSPLVAALLVPFALLPTPWGGLLWRGLNAAALLGALAWWAKEALPRPLTPTQRALLFLLFAPLAIGNLNNGQSNALVLGLLLAALTAAATDRWNLASSGVALACLFKVYPVALGLLLAVVYPRRCAGRLALALGIGLALPFLFQQPDYVVRQYLGWLEHLSTDERLVMTREMWYRDLRLLCDRCGMPLSREAYLLVQLSAAAAFAALCLAARRAGWPRRQLLLLILALACGWMTVFGSAAESATYILLAPIAAWGIVEALRQRQPFLIGLSLTAGYGLLLVTQLAGWFPWGRTFQSLGPQPAAGLFLLAGTVALAIHEHSLRRPNQMRALLPLARKGEKMAIRTA